ncbi:MAG: MFS transporter, partial [Bacillaceae bacterium G1]
GMSTDGSGWKTGWIKNIALFLGSQTLSLFGSQLVQYAIYWHITLTTQSGLMLTIYILCGFLPAFILSPFAGVWADRYYRKLLIGLSDAVIAAATLILAFFFLFGYQSLWLLFIISGIRALGGAVQVPAVSAMLPQLVPAEQLTRVNAVNGSIQSFVMLVAPIVSAALLSAAPLEALFFVDVVTAAAAITILFLFVHVPKHAKALRGKEAGYWSDLKKGFHYIREREYARKYFLFCAVFLVMSAPSAFLTPLQVARSFGDDIWRLTAIEIAFSTGMIVGGGLLALWGGFQNRVHTMAMACMMLGICNFLLGVVPDFWIYLFIMWL